MITVSEHADSQTTYLTVVISSIPSTFFSLLDSPNFEVETMTTTIHVPVSMHATAHNIETYTFQQMDTFQSIGREFKTTTTTTTTTHYQTC